MQAPDEQQPARSATSATDPEVATEQTTVSTAANDRPREVRAHHRTRTSVAFNSLLAGAIVLILLLVFILENTESVKISYFGASGQISLGVALLLAAVGGALLVGLTGAARVLQLRHRMHRPPRA